MKIFHPISRPVTAVLLAAFLPSLSVAQDSQFVLPDKPIKTMVVSITSQRHDGKIMQGFGFVIGFADRVPFIATANHLLRAPGSMQPPKSLTVRYVFFEGKAFKAVALPLFDGAADIGLISAAPVNGFKRLYDPEPADCPARLRRGDKLSYVGRGGDWYIPAEPGRFRGITSNGGILLENSDATEGSSGAPLVTKNGIVGMIVSGKGAGSVTAAPIDAIRRLFDRKVFLEDGTLVDEAWLYKEVEGLECDYCERSRARRPSEALKICPKQTKSYCDGLRNQGFPTGKRWFRTKWKMGRSCNCVPDNGLFLPNPPDGFRRLAKSELERLSCTSTELRVLFGRRLLLGGRLAPVLDQFRPLAHDFSAIFHSSHVELAKRYYNNEVERASTRVMEAGLEPWMVHLPGCIRWPAGLGRSRSFGHLLVQPQQSVILCTVVFDNPVRRGKLVQWPGFFYVNGRWVWMYGLENWGQ